MKQTILFLILLFINMISGLAQESITSYKTIENIPYRTDKNRFVLSGKHT
jgi:hypothetical protein